MTTEKKCEPGRETGKPNEKAECEVTIWFSLWAWTGLETISMLLRQPGMEDGRILFLPTSRISRHLHSFSFQLVFCCRRSTVNTIPLVRATVQRLRGSLRSSDSFCTCVFSGRWNMFKFCRTNTYCFRRIQWHQKVTLKDGTHSRWRA